MPRTLSHCHILVQRSPASIPKRPCRSSQQFANPTHHTNTLQTHTCTWDCYTIPWCTMPMGEEKMKKFHNVSAAPPLCRFSNFVSCEAGGRSGRGKHSTDQQLCIDTGGPGIATSVPKPAAPSWHSKHVEAKTRWLRQLGLQSGTPKTWVSLLRLFAPLAPALGAKCSWIGSTRLNWLHELLGGNQALQTHSTLWQSLH